MSRPKLFLTPIGDSAHTFVADLMIYDGNPANGIVVKNSLKF